MQFAVSFMSDGPSRVPERSQQRAEAACTAFAYGLRRDATTEEQIEAARTLATWVDRAYGPDASAFGEHMRGSHQIALVLSLLYVGEPELHRNGLMILANLVSDNFDVRSSETKLMVVQAHIFERLKDFLYAGDHVSRMMALACMQNLCTSYVE